MRFISMTNRTGSSWLCSMLDLAGPGYMSGEWMKPHNQLSPFDRDDSKSVEQHWNNLVLNDQNAEKRLVLKLNFNQFSKFIPKDAQLSPEHRFVFLTRDDKLAQAISQLALELTMKGEDLTLKSLDPARIVRLTTMYERSNAWWEKWYAENGIRPYALSYEDLRARPKHHVAGILEHYGDNEVVNSEQFAALPENGLQVSNPVNKLSYRDVWMSAMARYLDGDPNWQNELEADVPHDVFIDTNMDKRHSYELDGTVSRRKTD